MPKQLKHLSEADLKKITFLDEFYKNIKPIFYQNRGKNNILWPTTEQNKKRYYPCIPYSKPTIPLYLIRKNFPKNLNFLDVGCGYGHIVALASAIGFTAKGIEYGKEELFQDNIPADSYKINFSTDAFDLKKDFYSQFSVIFFYQPINDMKLCNELYKYVFDNCKKNTVFIIAGHPYLFSKFATELTFKNEYKSYQASFFIKE